MSALREPIASALRDIAAGLLLQKESRYRIAAYERAADSIEAFRGDLERFIDEGRLTEIPGIGDKIASVIEELRRTGMTKRLDELRRDLPEGALALARGPRLSKKAIATLSAAGIRDVHALRDAARAGKLRELAGFTEKTEARILAELERNDARKGKMVLRRAIDLANDLVRYLGVPADVVGDVRRGLEVIESIDVLATDPVASERFERWPKVVHLEPNLGRTPNGVLVRLHLVSPSERGRAMIRLTGPAEHAAALAPFEGATEEEIYAHARVAWIPPAVRTATLEAPPKLVDAGDIQGMVHCHTDYSDGADTIEAMARAAEARGMKYITITDHSQSAVYAHGVEIERLERQWDAIAEAQEKVSIRILRGTESDILKDGALDYPDDVLEKLDVVIASIHNRHRLDKDAMTARIVTALRHPMFKIWGHALGRILLNRPPIEVDIDAILDVAASSRVAIEINGDPMRLDMAPEHAMKARERRIPFVVSVDAHSVRELENVELGCVMAQRAGIEARHVLNTLDADSFAARVRPA